MVVLWDVERQCEVFRLKDEAGPIAFSPDCRLLATCRVYYGPSLEQVVTVWDTATGREQASFSFRPRPVKRVVFSPDRSLLAIGRETSDSAGVDVSICDLNTGREVAHLTGLERVFSLGSDLGFVGVLDRWEGTPTHSSRVPADPYLQLLAPICADVDSSITAGGRFHIDREARVSERSQEWEWIATTVLGQPPADRAKLHAVEFLDFWTKRKVAHVEGTGRHILAPGESRLAIVRGEGIEIWDLPPRQPLGFLLALAAVPSVLLTGLLWWRLCRRVS